MSEDTTDDSNDNQMSEVDSSDGEVLASGDQSQAIVQSTLNPIQSPASPAVQSASDNRMVRAEPPWTLQQFFNGEIDLDAELSKRFQAVPMMTSIKFRDLGSQSDRGVASVTTPDGAAQVVFDVDKKSHVVQMSFTWGSMLTLRFSMRELSDMDRSHWLGLMRRRQGGLAFLWGPTRWEQDYMICISRKFFTNIFAFSPNGYEAAVRFSPDVMRELLTWLEKYWEPDTDGDEEPPKLLTW